MSESVGTSGIFAAHPENAIEAGLPSQSLERWARKPDWLIAFALTLVLRVTYSVFAAIASLFLHPAPALVQSNALTSNLPVAGGWHYALLGIWARFDTLWYLQISAHGYSLPASTVFYPLYPALVRLLSAVMDPLLAALLISTASSFFLFWGFLLVVGHDFPRPIALRGLLLYAVWPASFVFFAGYNEALCVALLLWAIVCAQRDLWWGAAECAILAGLTRAAGGLVFVPLLILAFRRKQLAAWPILLAPLGGPAYLAWLRWVRHISFETVYREYWGTHIAWPWNTLWDGLAAVFHHPNAARAISIGVLLGFCLVIAFRRMRLEYRLYSAAIVLQILITNGPQFLLGSIRYVLPIFPIFIELPAIFERKGRPKFWFVCGSLFLFNLAWMYAFLNWSHVL